MHRPTSRFRRFLKSLNQQPTPKRRGSLRAELLEDRCVPSATTPFDLWGIDPSADGLFSDSIFASNDLVAARKKLPEALTQAGANTAANPSAGSWAGGPSTDGPSATTNAGDQVGAPTGGVLPLLGGIPSGLRSSSFQQPLPSGIQPLSSSIAVGTNAWTPIGPSPVSGSNWGNVSGRLTGVAADPGDPIGKTLYVAAAGGGVWKTTDGGTNWTPLTDNQSVLFMGSIAVIHPSGQSAIIYAGTGEANSSGDSFYGEGVLKSMNGGSTWSLMGNSVFKGREIGKVVIDTTDVTGNTVYVADSDWGVNGTVGGTGIWKTTNGGTSWTRLIGGTDDNFSDLVIDPSNHLHLVCAVGENQDSINAGVYETYNGGTTWAPSGNFPFGGSDGRIALAIAPSNSHVIYAAIADANTRELLGMYVTTNAGTNAATTSWTQLINTPNYFGANGLGQGGYDTMLAVSPTNSQEVFAGGSSNGGSPSIIETTNGGTSWTDISAGSAGPHTDFHAAGFTPGGNLLVGTDGGIWELTNPNVSSIAWNNLNGNLDTIQFTSIALNPNNANIVYGGSQDNGTEEFNNSTTWNQVLGGDGGFVAVDPTNTQIIYSELDGISLVQSTDGGTTWNYVLNGINTSDTSNFYVPFVMDPSNHQRLLYGTNHLYETTNSAGSWTAIATPGLNGFYTANASIDAIAISKSNPNTIYVSAGGTIYVTTNDGGTWTNVGAPASTTIQSLVVDPTNSNVVYAVTNAFNTLGTVFKTTDGGAIWSNIGGVNFTGPAWSIALDAVAGVLYVGTDTGVYTSSTSGGTWKALGTGMPHAQVTSLEWNATLGILAAGTHGRGAWEIQPKHLVFTTEPINHAAGALLGTIKVAIENSNGTVLTGDNNSQITIGIASGPQGSFNSGTTTVTVSSGVATFTNLVLDTAGVYKLSAADGTLSATSTSFTIVPAAAAKLVYLTEPLSDLAGQTLNSVKVAIEDRFGNVETANSTSTITIGIASGPGTFASGTRTVTVAGGIATFGNLVIDKAGAYKLSAACTGLTTVISNSFTVSPAAAFKLVYLTEPGNATAGQTLHAIQVAIEDRYGNIETADNSSSISIASGPGGFASGTLTQTVVNGIATFNDLVIDKAGTYTLKASAGTFSVTSTSFKMSPATAATILFLVEPANGIHGHVLNAIKVEVLDAFGNPVTSGSVTISIASGPGGFSSGTLTEPLVNGVATFSNLVINKAGTHTLKATDGALSVISTSFTLS
jgi:photosystem II stability/assembly factor-like uncharacterized protein